MTANMICKTEKGLGCLTLNRPKMLHALTHDMCQTMLDALVRWRDDETVQAIWIDHAPQTRGFCAGGDIRMLAESSQTDGKAALAFFRLEYQLNHLIKTFPKPIIAIMDGVTMGGGAGISVHGTYRVATENTVFAMPETGIGFMPDVGGGWFLPRLPGKIGLWLAMTGNRLKAADCLAANIATHFAESAQIANLKADIQAGLAQNQKPAQTMQHIAAIVAKPHGTPDETAKVLTEHICALIDKHFAHPRAEDIITALQAESDVWAAKQIDILAKKSPQALKVTLRQLQEGAKMPDFAANMAMEFTVAAHVVMCAEFHEGVRAVIIDKDHAPDWQYASVADVPDSDIDALFAPLLEHEIWKPLA